MQLVDGLSQHSPILDLGIVHVEFVVHEVIIGRFLRQLRLFAVSITTLPHIPYSISCHAGYKNLDIDGVVQ
jgi:hypothetical protein